MQAAVLDGVDDRRPVRIPLSVNDPNAGASLTRSRRPDAARGRSRAPVVVELHGNHLPAPLVATLIANLRRLREAGIGLTAIPTTPALRSAMALHGLDRCAGARRGGRSSGSAPPFGARRNDGLAGLSRVLGCSVVTDSPWSCVLLHELRASPASRARSGAAIATGRQVISSSLGMVSALPGLSARRYFCGKRAGTPPPAAPPSSGGSAPTWSGRERLRIRPSRCKTRIGVRTQIPIARVDEPLRPRPAARRPRSNARLTAAHVPRLRR